MNDFTPQTLGAFAQAVARAALNPNYAAAAGLSGDTGPDGGFIVPPPLAGRLLDAMYAMGDVLRLANGFPATRRKIEIPAIGENSRADGSRFGGLQLQWTPEGGQIPASKPQFAARLLQLHKLAGLVPVTEDLLEEAEILEGLLELLFGLEASFCVEREMISGGGVGRPLGVLNAPATITVAKESGQAAASIVSENILGMWERLWSPAKRRAVWLVTPKAASAIFGMTTTDPLVGKLFDFAPDGSPRLLGRPILETEYNLALGGRGDIILGDFGQYLLGRRGDPEVISSMHLRFDTGERVFRLTFRVDGMPAWAEPTTPLHGSDTVSPFVTLAERA